jgi:hypothetical protein
MRTPKICILLLALASCATGLLGQTSRASVSGIITDPSGGVLNGATVTIRDLDRGTVYTSTSNHAGLFLVPELSGRLPHRACERSISSYDVPKRLVLYCTYQLPFGNGKRIGAN